VRAGASSAVAGVGGLAVGDVGGLAVGGVGGLAVGGNGLAVAGAVGGAARDGSAASSVQAVRPRYSRARQSPEHNLSGDGFTPAL
jgi:hypothetical protein